MLKPETQSWLDGLLKEGSLPAETVASLRAAAESNPATEEYIRGSVLRQSDYSKGRTEIDEAKKAADKAIAEAAQAKADADEYKVQLQGWKAGAEPEYNRALTAEADARGKAVAATERLKAIAKAYGVDESQLGLEPVVDKSKEPAAGTDLSGYLKADEFDARLKKTVAESALIDASIHDLDMEYFNLTGKHLTNAAALVTEAITSGKNLREFAEGKLNLPKLRSDAAEKTVQERIDREVAEKVAAALSDPGRAQAGGRGDEPRSPIFGRKEALPMPAVIDAGAGGGGVSAAMAAYQTGKFKAGK
jgi:hypothetical protein